MSNNIKNSFELFKVQLKWNAKTVSFWITLGIYVLITTALSIAMFLLPQAMFGAGEINSDGTAELFLFFGMLGQIIMIGLIINILIVRVFVSNKKHKIDELEKRAGYNKFSIFNSRLVWLVVVIFSTIFVNLLISLIAYLSVDSSQYGYFAHRMFIDVYGWTTVFAFIYLTISLLALFLMGPARQGIFSLVVLAAFNLVAMVNATTGSIGQTKMYELDWTVNNSIWYKDAINEQKDDVILNEMIEFYSGSQSPSEDGATAFGYDFYETFYEIRSSGNGYVPPESDFLNVEKFFNDLKITFKDLDKKWKIEDVFFLEKNNRYFSKVDRPIYDLIDDIKDIDFSNMGKNGEYENVFKLLKFYIDEMLLLDSVDNFDYYNIANISVYGKYGNNSGAKQHYAYDILKDVYPNRNAFVYATAIIGWIFKTHNLLTNKLTIKNNETNDLKTFTNYIDYNSASGKEWYVSFNPTIGDKLNLIFNPLNHFALMQKSSYKSNDLLQEAVTLKETRNGSMFIDSNLKIDYKHNKEGEIISHSFSRVIPVWWIYIFYTLLSIGLLPLTYLLWRRKNK
ncbi:hypothetical protein [Spiroplasma endosymbiont of Othius punctulatus]|uniref:hypothetical protein n=1 Tax=Spiroplasma endosymbiont of Othius punctulatus TaxID=3066289 RepID=UPI0030D0B2D3